MLASLGVQVATAVYLGAGWERDALFVAMSVPLFLNSLLAGSVGVVVTPAVLSSSSPGGQRRLASRLLAYLAVTMVVVAAILYAFRLPLAGLLAPGFDVDRRFFTAGLLALSVTIIPFQASTSVLTGYLVAKERVLLPSVALALGNAATLGSVIFIGSSLTAAHVALATLAGAILACVIQLAVFVQDCRNGDRSLPDSTPNVSRVCSQALPLILSGLVSRSNPLVERHLASSLGSGTISCLGYSGYLVSFLVNATAGPTMTVFYARMCNLWNVGDRDGVGRILEKSLCYVITVSLAIGGLLVLVGADLFHVLFRYTRFTSEGVTDLVTYSKILMISYLFLATGGVISRLFYAAGCSLRVSLLDCLGTFFYAVVAFSLVHPFKGTGLAIAASIYSIFVVSLFLGWAYRQFRTRLHREFAATIGMVFLTWGSVFAVAMLVRHLVLQGFPAGFSSALVALFYLGGLAFVIRFALRRTGAPWRDPTRRESERPASLDVFRQ